MKQECKLIMVWFTWIGIPVLALIMGILQGWPAAVAVLIIGVFAQVYYVKVFPKFSHLLGYGSIEDVAADIVPEIKVLSKVILYTANVCPFCPIVRQRLTGLQKDLEFKLEEMDITFKPNLIKEKGFQSVPIIEKDGKYLFGNATSAQIIEFLTK